MKSEPYPEEVHLVVGGYHYYLQTDDLLDHPDSYFAHMLKDEWIKDKTAAVTMDRNGKVFRHVIYYLYSGYMNPDCKPIYDLDVLVALRTEADFYGLPELVTLCDYRIKYDIEDILTKQRNVGIICDCVRENEERSTDALVCAMDIFRPSTIATSRLETYSYDTLESYYKNVSDLLKSKRDSLFRSIHNCSFAHKCYKVGQSGFMVNSNIRSAFSEWPLTMGKRNFTTSFSARHIQVYIYRKGGFCISHVPTTLADGSFLYIFNSEHTGGRVTTKVNGEEVSIELPGECMALLPGCSYSVETVTSGFLVLFEYIVEIYGCADDDADDDGEVNNKRGGGDAKDTTNDAIRRENEDADEDDSDAVSSDWSSGQSEGQSDGQSDGVGEGDGEGAVEMESDSDDSFESHSDSNSSDSHGIVFITPLVWQLRDTYSTEITPERSGALTQAINAALLTYEGVVLCLSTYYPTGHSTHKARRCETDPALLKRFDADLHAHLSTFYEVTVVTVAVSAADKGRETETETGTETESGDSTARVLDFPHDADMRLKVVAPMQSVGLDRGESATMLLTGLLCFARE